MWWNATSYSCITMASVRSNRSPQLEADIFYMFRVKCKFLWPVKDTTLIYVLYTHAHEHTQSSASAEIECRTPNLIRHCLFSILFVLYQFFPSFFLVDVLTELSVQFEWKGKGRNNEWVNHFVTLSYSTCMYTNITTYSHTIKTSNNKARHIYSSVGVCHFRFWLFMPHSFDASIRLPRVCWFIIGVCVIFPMIALSFYIYTKCIKCECMSVWVWDSLYAFKLLFWGL